MIQDQSRSHKASLLQLGRDFQVDIQSHSLQSQVFDFKGPKIWYKGLEITMAGRHQSVNAGLAVSACMALADPLVTEQTIRQGLKSTGWPGRMNAYCINPSLILDCAHNLDSFKKLTHPFLNCFRTKENLGYRNHEG